MCGRVALLLLLAVLNSACSARSQAAVPTTRTALPGVDTRDLDEREHAKWWRLVNEMLAPCPAVAVTVAACVEEHRQCPECTAAASLLARQVRAGLGGQDAQSVVDARFSRDIVQVDLSDSPSKGPENAPVTVVVWADFQCSVCRLTLPQIEKVFAQTSPKVRLVHKFSPLPTHERAEHAARAAVAAMRQDRFWEMEVILFENQQALQEADLLRYAERLGLDIDRFKADMNSAETTQLIERDKEAGHRAGLRSTPHILVNGRRFDLRMFRVDEDLREWIELDAETSAR